MKPVEEENIAERRTYVELDHPFLEDLGGFGPPIVFLAQSADLVREHQQIKHLLLVFLHRFCDFIVFVEFADEPHRKAEAVLLIPGQGNECWCG